MPAPAPGGHPAALLASSLPRMIVGGELLPMTGLTRRQALASLLATGPAGFARAAQAAESVARVTFLLVNDVYRMDADAQGRGGLPKLATVVASERARAAAGGRTLIFAHAGDTLSPSLMSALDQGAHMIDLFNAVGLDIFVPGNHEFDFGRDVYLARMAEARFAVLAANLRDAHGSPLPNHSDRRDYDVGALKIAVIGTTYDASAAVSHLDDLVVTPTQPRLAAEAAAARAAGAGLVVAVVHADRALGTALLRAQAADIILSGHNHDLHVEFDGRAVLLESHQDANYVSAIDVDVAIGAAEGGERRITWWPSLRITESGEVAPDPTMLARVRAYQAGLSRTLDVPVATLADPLDSRIETVRQREAPIGELFADAIRDATKADLAILNGGGIRGNRLYAAGSPITRKDVLTELPFGNKTVVVSVTGAEVLAALENGLARLGGPSGRFPQLSGMVVHVDTAAAAGGRVRAVWVGSTRLAPERIYRLATNDFMARGGDGYTMLAHRTPVTVDSGAALVAQNVMDYFARAQSLRAPTDARIIFE
jgi:2',3'-cyclic-nucleotide 2'-phosphodiesterase (5'-nucleotidase family)